MNVVSREVTRRIWSNCRCVITIIMLISLAQSKHIKTSINKHQLQYIADHLTHDECLLLIKSLHEEETLIEEIEDLPGLLNKENTRSCKKKLMDWRQNGKGKKSTHFMIMHLKHLDHAAIAEKLPEINSHDKYSALNTNPDMSHSQRDHKRRKKHKKKKVKNINNKKKDFKGKKKKMQTKKDSEKKSGMSVWVYIIVIIITIPLLGAACYFLSQSLCKGFVNPMLPGIFDRKYNNVDEQENLIDPNAPTTNPGIAETAAPGMDPGMAPHMASEMFPGMASEAAPGMAPEMTPGMAPGMVPRMAHGMAPGIAPGTLPGTASGAAPKIASKMPMGTAPGMAPRQDARRVR